MSADLSESFGSEVVLLSAADDAALVEEAGRLAHFLEQAPAAELSDVAYTCARNFSGTGTAVLAIVTSSTAELRSRLVSASTRIAAGAERVRDKSGTYYFRAHLLGEGADGKLAFVFPGAASFYPDMLRDLSVRFVDCRSAFDELEAALKGDGPFVPSSFVFPPAPYYRHDADVFTAGGYAEAMVSTYSANTALFRLFQALGVKPDGVTGFSGGDLNALAAAGVLGKFERVKRLKFLREMYKLVNTAVNHAGLPTCVMVSVVSPHPERTEEILAAFAPDKVTVAFRQSPRQLTLALAPDVVDVVQHALGEVGARGMRLPVDRPFNTPWCASNLSAFRKFAGNWVDDKPHLPVYSCGTAALMPDKARKVRDIAAEQWAQTVRFDETIRLMHADGYRVFLEVGPRGVATNAIDEILKGSTYAALASDSVHRAGLLQLQHTFASLAALGAAVAPAALFEHRRCRALDLAAPLTLNLRTEAELRLSRAFPHLRLMADDPSFGGAMATSAASTPGTRNKPAARAAAVAARQRRKRQFEFGALNPLISDADITAQQPGVSLEIAKTFTFASEPFLADFALGVPQIAYSDPSLRGLTLLPLVAGAEIMAELAQMLVPNRHVAAMIDLQSRRTVAFRDGKLTLFVRAERIASSDPDQVAVKVQLREDSPNSAWTWPVMEGTFALAEEKEEQAVAFTPPPMSRPRDVHWTESDIYPDRLYAGGLLQHIKTADRWSETGIDYEVEVPSSAGAVTHTRFPLWALNPQLLGAVADGFTLWRSHERFPGAFSFAFRLRQLTLHARTLATGTRLHCYLRNTGVTPQSLITDILVSDGNGTLVMELHGYEELTERVPDEYRQLLLAPARTFLTKEIPPDRLGAPATAVASAMFVDVPYPIFERNEKLWLRTVSQIVLDKSERREFASMTGGTARCTEWLFGRIAAKEAVRRFLAANYQARWCDADVVIYRDDSGKPHPIGKWNDFLSSKIDLAIAHTAQFVVAVVAANARVGVDVESRDRDLSDEFTRGVFTPEEQELATRAADAPSAILRFWCAKESVSKALGTGIRYSPKELLIDSFLADTGEMEVRLSGQWLENFKMFTGRTIHVSSSIVRGHVLASCFIPASLFS